MEPPPTTPTRDNISAMIKHGFLPDPPYKIRVSPTRSPPSSKSSPTLLEMMSNNHEDPPKLPENPHHKLQERVDKIISGFTLSESGDVKLKLRSKEGFSVSMRVQRRVLVGKSGFFVGKLPDKKAGHLVEIEDCDDVEAYVETLVLMHSSEDLRKRLMKEELQRVLAVLKVSVAIMFEAGIISCLECIEAMPWSEEEEETVISVLNALNLQGPAIKTLERVSVQPSTSESFDGVFLQLMEGVLQAKDEKARREMKALISALLKENNTHNKNHNRIDISKETLYHICHCCIDSLLRHFMEATAMETSGRDRGLIMAEISRESDNLQWVVDILVDRQMGEEFVSLWADQSELSALHSRIPTMYRYEISKVTAQLCVAIGRGQILTSKEARFSLLQTWLEALYDDFGWMRRAGKPIDKKLVEDGLSQTVLTLPLAQQQVIVVNWFDRFLNNGDDYPNLRRAFEVWWRRAFVRRFVVEEIENSRLQLAVCDYSG
ncbi:BTB/POZ domain-containing protein At5g60050 [Amborella trichopoda]|uniref:At3g05675-like ankyrin-like domain-containing protein n=1 Tax=Amborella trichopoda TaxID=13333 RepID=W1NJM7_AMBTC|nr:BTB/POZ domain-containing protein At5g60050 [Amborella trichopoda]ERM95651.1 hypothetical protein AMTR_s00023p00185370 [Amborella trichopoda]|eukprot:XP_006828235.1 BTB/POZ domain-containing protein At5g60050 [Amborella trichopoda]